MKNTNNNSKNMNNNNEIGKAMKAKKSAEFQAARLEKAQSRFEAAKVYTEKKTGIISESLRQLKASRIAAMDIESLATACVARSKDLSKTSCPKDLLRYLKAEVANCVRNNIGASKLALFVDCTRGEFKVDSAIKFACAGSRNPEIKDMLKELAKKAK